MAARQQMPTVCQRSMRAPLLMLLLILLLLCGSGPAAADWSGRLIEFQTLPEPEKVPPQFRGYGVPDAEWPVVLNEHHTPLRFPGGAPDPLSFFRFQMADPNAADRHIGRGNPLVGTSWLNRPVHAGWFFGGLIGDDLIDGRIDQTDDMFGGYRIGWDWDHYWGHEVRLGFARTDLADTGETHRIARDWFFDAHLAYYPWGDAQWRPYASAGLGLAVFQFRDESLVEHDEILLHMPVGMGVKYLVDRWLAVRVDVMDNLALSGSGLDTMHNITYTIGIEAHFGRGTSRKYTY